MSKCPESLTVSVETTLRRFALSQNPAALVFQGQWGIGKTYLWNKKVLEPHLRGRPREHYSYVSLFGVNSLDDTKIAVAQATQEADALRTFKWKKFLSPRWLLWRFMAVLPAIAGIAPSKFGGGPSLTKSINALSFFLVRNRLVCFDDIERRGTGLSLGDFLGLVSFLVEQRSCRILVILNTDRLDDADRKAWEEQKEKVFEAEVVFKPELSESIKLGLSGSEGQRWHAYATKSLADLSVGNIRLIRRTVRAIELVFETVDPMHLHQDTVAEITRMLTLLVYSHAGRSLGAPPLEFTQRFGPFSLAMEQLRGTESKISAEEHKWMEILSNYNLILDGVLSTALAESVVSGYPDPDNLEKAVVAFEGNVVAREAKQRYQEAWNLYHNYVTNNLTEFLDALESSWPDVSDVEHVSNLLSTVRLLRDHGRAEIASRFINKWVEERQGGRREELDPREMSLFGPVDDAELLQSIERSRQLSGPPMSLESALVALGEQRDIEDACATLALTEPSAIAEALITNPGDRLHRTIQTALEIGRGQGAPEKRRLASEKMRVACQIIAQQSEWQRSRIVRKFGQLLDDDMG